VYTSTVGRPLEERKVPLQETRHTLPSAPMESSSLINGDPVPPKRRVPILAVVIGVLVVASVVVLGLTFGTGTLLGQRHHPETPTTPSPTESPCPGKDVHKPCTTKPATTKPGTTSPATTRPITTSPATTTPVQTTPNITTPVQTTGAPTPSPTNATTSPPNTTLPLTTPPVTTPNVTTPVQTTPNVTTLPSTTLPSTTLPATTLPVTTPPATQFCNASLCQIRDLLLNLSATLALLNSTGHL
jgi:cytoskeletal protein RodZ